jgi:hypothetical protein
MIIRYSRLRIFLLTFMLGWVSAGTYTNHFDEIPVDLPKVKSESPIIVDIYPTKRLLWQYGGSWGCGGLEEETKASRKTRRKRR